jgi:plasmid stabilization system protein ParE
MVKKRWSRRGFDSLRSIFEYYGSDSNYGKRIVEEVIEKIDQLKYVEQYQVDEIVGAPYRRIIVGRFRVVYKVVSFEEIEVLQVFDNRQSPERLKNDFEM